jgi:Transposase domain (DUF772)
MGSACQRQIVVREEFPSQVYTDDPGRLPLPTRLMAGLAILKHTYDLSDEVLCERWLENPVTSSSAARSARPAKSRIRYQPLGAAEAVSKADP